MFKFTKRDKRTKLEREIDWVLEDMSILERDSDEYSAMAGNLERLYEAKGNDPKRGVSLDTIAIIAGNLLGIILILNYEKANIITTKAIQFVLKGRV